MALGGSHCALIGLGRGGSVSLDKAGSSHYRAGESRSSHSFSLSEFAPRFVEVTVASLLPTPDGGKSGTKKDIA